MAGAKQLMGVALAACLAAVLFQVSSAATSHIVGDSTGWTIPSSTSFYTSWAAKETFNVGDFIVFNFMNGAHTVAEVKKSDYDSCTTTSPLSQLNNGPANISISSAGTHYYICTVPGHCTAGQKLSITASAATSTPSSPTAAPTPKSTPTPSASPTPKSSPAVPSPSTSPTPKSSPAVPSPSASPTPKSSPAVPSPSAGAPTPVAASPTPSPTSSISTPPTSSPTPAAAAPGSSPAASPTASPGTAPTPSPGAGTSPSPSAAAGGPPAPSTPTEAPTSPRSSDSTVAGAGLVLPLLVVIGASLLY